MAFDNVIDTSTVELRFDNKQFEKETKKSKKSIEKLKSSLSFKQLNKETKKFSLNPVSVAVNNATSSFSSLAVMGISALNKITEQAVVAGETMLKALTIQPVMEGLDKNQAITKATNTILTQTKKVVGEDGITRYVKYTKDEVEAAIDELVWYADETSYSLSDMVDSLSKFTAAGVNLDEAIPVIIGINNATAKAGQNAQAANRVMYNLAQTLSKGYVMSIDWRSVSAANVSTMDLKQAIVETAKELGTLTAEGIPTTKTMSDLNDVVTTSADDFGILAKSAQNAGNQVAVTAENMDQNLSSGWFTKDVLTAVMAKYGNYAESLYQYVQTSGETASEAMKTLGDMGDAFGKEAFESAQVAMTFEDAINATKDAVSTGWSNIFSTIFGDVDEQKKEWTDLAQYLYDVFMTPVNKIQEVLDQWKDLGGRDDLVAAIYNLGGVIERIVGPIKDAWNKIFNIDPETRTKEIGTRLAEWSKSFRELTDAFVGETKDQKLQKLIDEGAKDLLDDNQLRDYSKMMDTEVNPVTEQFVSTTEHIGNAIGNVFAVVKIIKTVAEGLWKILEPVRNTIKDLLDSMLGLSDTGLKNFREFATELTSDDIVNAFNEFKETPIGKILSGLATAIGAAGNAIYEAITFIVSIFRKGSPDSDIPTAVDEYGTELQAASESLEKSFKDTGVGKVLSGIGAFFQDIVDGIAGIFNKLGSLFKKKDKTTINPEDALPVTQEEVKWYTGILESLEKALDTVLQAFKKVKDKFLEWAKEASFVDITKAFALSGVGAGGFAIAGFFTKINLGEAFADLVDFFTPLERIAKSIQLEAIGDTIKKMAEGLLMLVASVLLLSSIDDKALESSINALENLIGVFGLVMAILVGSSKTGKDGIPGGSLYTSLSSDNSSTKITQLGKNIIPSLAMNILSMSTAFIKLSLAMLIMAAAIKTISKVPIETTERVTKVFTDILQSFAIVVGMMAILTGEKAELAGKKQKGVEVPISSMSKAFGAVGSLYGVSSIIGSLAAVMAIIALSVAGLAIVANKFPSGFEKAAIMIASILGVLIIFIGVIASLSQNKTIAKVGKDGSKTGKQTTGASLGTAGALVGVATVIVSIGYVISQITKSMIELIAVLTGLDALLGYTNPDDKIDAMSRILLSVAGSIAGIIIIVGVISALLIKQASKLDKLKGGSSLGALVGIAAIIFVLGQIMKIITVQIIALIASLTASSLALKGDMTGILVTTGVIILGVLAIVGAMTILLVKQASKIKSADTGSIGIMALVILAFGVAIGLIISAVAKLFKQIGKSEVLKNKNSTGNLAIIFGGIILIIGLLLATISVITKASKGKDIDKSAIGTMTLAVLGFGVAVGLIIDAIAKLFKQMGKAGALTSKNATGNLAIIFGGIILIIGLLLATIAIITKTATKLSSGDWVLILSSFAGMTLLVIGIAEAMKIVSEAVSSMGSDWWKPLLVLGVMVVALMAALAGLLALSKSSSPTAILAIAFALAGLGIAVAGIGAGILLTAKAIEKLMKLKDKGVLKFIRELVKTLIVGLLEGMKEVAPMINELIPQVLETIMWVFISKAYMIIEGILTFIDLLYQYLPTITEKLVPVINGIFDALMAILWSLDSLIAQLVEWLIVFLVDFINATADTIKSESGNIAYAIRNLIESLLILLWDVIKELFWMIVDFEAWLGEQPWVQNIGKWFGGIFSAIGEWFAKVFSAIGKWFADVFSAIGNWFSNLISSIGEWFARIFYAIGNWCSNLVKSIVGWFDKIFSEIGNWFSNLIPAMGKWFGNVFSAIGNWFSNLITSFVGWGKALIEGFWEGIKRVWQTFIDYVSGLWNKFIDFFRNLFGIHSPSTLFADFGGYIIQGLLNGIKGIWDSMINAISTTWHVVTDWFGKIFSWIAEALHLDDFASTFLDLPSKIVEWVKEKLNTVKEFFGGLWDNIKSWFGGKSKGKDILKEEGRNITEGLGEGMEEQSKLQKLKSKVTTVANNVKSWFQGLFDINSPSKVTAEMGEYLDEGLAVGMEHGIGTVIESTKEVAAKTEKSLNGALSKINLDAIGDDSITSPVITPILDMSNLQNGVGDIGRLFDTADVKVSAGMYTSKKSVVQSEIDYLNQAVNKLGERFDNVTRAVSNINVEPEVKVTLAGDAAGVFKLVKQQNDKYIRTAGYSPL